MNCALIAAVALCALLLPANQASPTSDLITSLPGLSKLPPFKMYSGYLDADKVNNKKLFYWFVESSSNPAKDPLALWLTGGPGCSSVLALLTENGPLQFDEQGQMRLSPFSWNQVANVLYIESPAGVGFSYANDGDYKTNDSLTALENSQAVQHFFAKFPEFQNHEFFITGESYGGVYVPSLSAEIMEIPSINFKGFAVGNGLSSYEDNEDSIIYFAYYHGLISDGLWRDITSKCCSKGGPYRCRFSQESSQECQDLVSKVNVAVSGSGIDVYNLYAECAGGVGTNTGFSTIYRPETGMFHSTYFGWPFGKSRRAREEMAKRKLIPRSKLSIDPPCLNFTVVTKYLNTEIVKQALHVSEKAFKWAACSPNIDYHSIYTDMSPFYKKAIAKNLRMMVYNGDVDMACNFLGDEWFVDRLPLKNPSDRKVWYYNAADGTKQVAGFIKTFDLMSLVTVRGSGHMVPTDRPRPGLEMITNFFHNKPFNL